MSDTKDIFLGEFNIGSVDRLRFTLEKDGDPWTGIDSVAIVFESPDRSTKITRAAILEDDDAGIWYYDTTTVEIDEVGDWTVSVRVTDGAVVKRYPYEISMHVNDQP